MTDGVMDFPEPPAELIAQAAPARRDAARLMTLDRAAGTVGHGVFRDVLKLFRRGDVLVLNDARVFPARLVATKPTGGRVRMLLLERNAAGDRWTSLLTPAQRPGVRLSADKFAAVVEAKRESGEYELSFSPALTDADVERLGRMPLPPYIRRGERDGPEVEARDRADYQTVYAAAAPPPSTGAAELRAPGAVAAPTAGLHFTPELLAGAAGAGVEVRRLRLDVGWGTFRPIQGDDHRAHKMMAEGFAVPAETAEAVNRAKAEGRRVWAVGTTAVRALEGAADERGRLAPGAGSTAIYIYPGHRFRVVDALVTNFHLRNHTPLLLAAAFAGTEFLRRAYGEAVRERYRFLSYGDGMAIY